MRTPGSIALFLSALFSVWMSAVISSAADSPAPLEPLEIFLKDQRRAITEECGFADRKSDVVHEAAWARFKGIVERRIRRDGTDDLKARWTVLAGMTPSEISRSREFSGLLRTYASARYAGDLLGAVRELVRCRTVEDTTIAITENQAFQRATAIVDSLAREHGFEFNVLADGMALEVAFGAGTDTLGIWGHLDVVPADSTGWSVDPWAGIVVDGVLEARGVEDDKGAFTASLFALRALRDTGVPLKRRVMLFGGYGEETTFDGIDGYLEARPVPSINVVVDGAFPVVVGEKGQTTITVSSSFSRTQMRLCRTGYIIRGLRGGIASNQVPDYAEVRLYPAKKGTNAAFFQIQRKVEEFNQNNSRAHLTASRDGVDIVVAAEGTTAHGSTPKSGHNAIVDIVEFLTEFGTTCPNPPHWVCKFVNEFIREDTRGFGLGIAASDSIMGSTTVNVGWIAMEGDSAYVKLDIRFPPGLTPDSILETIRDRIKDFDTRFNSGLGVFRNSAGFMPIYVGEDTDLVLSLIQSYEEVYGRSGEPVSIAGTTYAKRLSNAVSFGPALPGETRAHTAGEFMTVQELDNLLRVYATAFFRLSTKF